MLIMRPSSGQQRINFTVHHKYEETDAAWLRQPTHRNPRRLDIITAAIYQASIRHCADLLGEAAAFYHIGAGVARLAASERRRPYADAAATTSRS